MKWVLIYVIMTTTHGSVAIVHEFDDATACDYAWDMMDQSVRPARERDGLRTLTISTCLPKGTAK